jgi:RHS repeat-associated protein
VIREGEAFRDGSFTTRSALSGAFMNSQSNLPTGEKYRWVGDGTVGRTAAEDGYTVTGSRFGSRGVTLYGNGEAVAMSSSAGSRSMYLGKDIMGSVRSVTVDTGALEDRYEYDAFGQPYTGDLTGGMNLGYTGKPYDANTGLYNYGYRDYKPHAARFTTVDPIRDGSNWFAYVNNDPMNYIDLWGLDMMYSTYTKGSGKITTTYIPTNPNGSIDYSNIKTYNFSATNNISPNLATTIPANKDEKGQYYYPQSFPTGTVDVGKSNPVPDNHKDKQFLGDVYTPTNAKQPVDTYGLTPPVPGAQPTGKQVDTGYGLHYSEKGVTQGCIGFGTQDDANRFAALSNQALDSKDGTSKLTVVDPKKKEK